MRRLLEICYLLADQSIGEEEDFAGTLIVYQVELRHLSKTQLLRGFNWFIRKHMNIPLPQEVLLAVGAKTFEEYMALPNTLLYPLDEE